MFSNIKKLTSGKILLFLLLLFSLLLLVGCASAPTRGWSGPMVSDNVLYVGSIAGKMIALDISQGKAELLWDKDLGSPETGGAFACSARLSTPMSTYGTPAIEDEVLYIGGYDGNVYAIDITTRMMSEFDTGSAIVGSPVVADETVFVGNSEGKFYALNLDLSPKWPTPFETGDKIWSTPAVDNGVVYIGSSDHKLYAIDIESGQEIWHFVAEAAVLSTPLVVEGTVYIGACDDNFYAIDAATEEERKAVAATEREARWIFDQAENWFWTQALLYNGEIWVGSLDHKVYAINVQNPADFQVVLETQGRVRTPPLLVDGLIIVGSEDGNIYEIDPQEKKSSILKEVGAPILAPLCLEPEKGIVYVHAQDGNHTLYAIEVETGDIMWDYSTE